MDKLRVSLVDFMDGKCHLSSSFFSPAGGLAASTPDSLAAREMDGSTAAVEPVARHRPTCFFKELSRTIYDASLAVVGGISVWTARCNFGHCLSIKFGAVGYGKWNQFFPPRILERVINIAANFYGSSLSFNHAFFGDFS